MTVEWLIMALLLGVVVVSLGRRVRRRSVWVGLVVIYSLVLSAAAWWQRELQRREKARVALDQKAPRIGGPSGYVTSDNCKACHPEPYSSWHRSFHRTMTQVPSPAAVRGKFDGKTLLLGNEPIHLEERDGDFWAEMV